MITANIGSWIIFSTGFAAAILGFRHYRMVAHERRMAELRAATSLIDSYGEAVAELAAAAGVPRRALDLLELLGVAIGDRAVAFEIAQITLSRESAREDVPPALFDEIAAIDSGDGRLVAAFDRAIVSGFEAMLLRWPETAKLFPDIQAKVSLPPRRALLRRNNPSVIAEHAAKAFMSPPLAA